MSYYGNDYYSSYLFHHGILGQKWGVRRYQNPDGTLTPAGKARYSNLSEKEQKQVASKLEYLYKKNRSKSQPAITGKGFDDFANEIIKQNDISKYKEQYNSINKRMDELSKKMAVDNIHDDYESEENKEMHKEAIQKILDNKSSYIDPTSAAEAEKYAKDNNISIWETKPYSRALEYEIYDGDTGAKYEKIWEDNHKENIKASKEWDKEYDKLMDVTKGFGESVLGQYGKQNLTGDKYYVRSAQDFLNESLNKYLKEEYRSSKNNNK